MTSGRLSISVLTACTAVKSVTSQNPLTKRDFMEGRSWVEERGRQSVDPLVPAENLYRGQQHLRLMRGVDAIRAEGHDVTVSIVSAGYGLVSGDEMLAPYDCTFQGMSAYERRTWSDRLGLPESMDRLLTQPRDLQIILLGDDYFQACAPEGLQSHETPQVVICGARTALRMVPSERTHQLILREADTRRFACGLVGLKGEVAGRLLRWLATEPTRAQRVASTSLLDELANEPLTSKIKAPA